MLIPEDYQSLIWFIFPSEVLPELLALKNTTFEALTKVSSQDADQKWTTPYEPRDYNKSKHKFTFSEEYRQA